MKSVYLFLVGALLLLSGCSDDEVVDTRPKENLVYSITSTIQQCGKNADCYLTRNYYVNDVEANFLANIKTMGADSYILTYLRNTSLDLRIKQPKDSDFFCEIARVRKETNMNADYWLDVTSEKDTRSTLEHKQEQLTKALFPELDHKAVQMVGLSHIQYCEQVKLLEVDLEEWVKGLVRTKESGLDVRHYQYLDKNTCLYAEFLQDFIDKGIIKQFNVDQAAQACEELSKN